MPLRTGGPQLLYSCTSYATSPGTGGGFTNISTVFAILSFMAASSSALAFRMGGNIGDISSVPGKGRSPSPALNKGIPGIPSTG